MSEPKEPEIIINGIEIDDACAMAIRVAVGNLMSDMEEPNALGGDNLGKSIAAGYLARCKEITTIMQNREIVDV